MLANYFIIDIDNISVYEMPVPKYLIDRAKDEIKRDEDILILTVASSIVASLGISLGNFAVIIGSMLIAPFFDPIISFVVLASARKGRSTLRALGSIALITITAMIVATGVFLVIATFGEIGDYSMGNLLTVEYFIIAVTLGVIGILMWLWPSSSSTVAGISVAISLIPPLAASARELVLLNWSSAVAFFLMYLLNMFGIVVGGYIVLILKERRS